MPIKPSGKEEEFVAKTEYLRLKKIEEEKHKDLAEDEKKKIKALHFMKCPKCGMDLIALDYKGIEVDKCSECEGIWLDAGELEMVSKAETSGIDKLFGVFKRE